MPFATVNGKQVEFKAGMTVLQVCEIAGSEIPRFCYHERLSIAGNCRMCLVQIEGGPPKPAASCAMPAAEGMVIHTDSEMVKKARQGVMEFLLINHPLDCPICDQGGECDLQDQSIAYGSGLSRFEENKRSVKEKDFGPLIKTHMTRCIHCTRCVRFLTEVSGIEELGATGRGESMEIGTFIEKSIFSELSGNIIDLCPVGALTSKPYAFKARPWELRKVESVDVHDAVGSNIRIDVRGREVMRILPRLNEDINEEWISDKTRFSYDGLRLQRLDRPMVKSTGKLKECDWDTALSSIKELFKKYSPQEIGVIAGDLVDVESMAIMKLLLEQIGCDNYDCRQMNEKFDAENRSSYIFNTTIAGIEQADACLIIGANPRYDASLINARIRKTQLQNNMPIAVIGSEVDLTYKYDYLGSDINILRKILADGHPFAKILTNAKNPMIIVGESLVSRKDGAAMIALAQTIAAQFGAIREDWNGFNILHKAAARVGGLDIKFVPQNNGYDVAEMMNKAQSGELKLLYLLGADEIDLSSINKDVKVIYQGHHGDRGAHRADIILPGCAYTEKDATYVNTEGRVQNTYRAVFAPNQAMEDWQIINNIAKTLLINLNIDSLSDVRRIMKNINPIFMSLDNVQKAEWSIIESNNILFNDPIIVKTENFYKTNPICRASQIMSDCSKEFFENKAKEVA